MIRADIQAMRKCCTIMADLSPLLKKKRMVRSIIDRTHAWKIHYKIEIKLGTTELEAQLKWEENVSQYDDFCNSKTINLLLQGETK